MGLVVDSYRFGAAGGDAPALIQSKSAASSSVTADSAFTEGSLLVLATGGSNNPTGYSSLTGAGWTLGPTILQNQYAAIFYKVAGASEPTTITEALGGTSQQIAVLEFDPASATLDDSDTTAATTATSTTVGPTGTLDAAVGVAVAMMLTPNDFSAPSMSDGFTIAETLARMVVGYKILSSSAAVQTTFTWTTSRASASCLAVFT
jgi:hypothetical protein